MSTLHCSHVTPQCPVEATTYGYKPNIAGSIFFAAMFGGLGCLHFLVNAYFQAWTFLVSISLGAILELLGYAARCQMHFNPWDSRMFKLQIVTLIVAPTFIAAGIYLTMKHIILAFGREHAIMSPNMYIWIFITSDIFSLILQAAGGITASAAPAGDRTVLDAGNDVMIAGIAFQVFSMLVFGVMATLYAYRVVMARKNAGLPYIEIGPGPWSKAAAVGGEILAYVTILCRCAYR